MPPRRPSLPAPLPGPALLRPALRRLHVLDEVAAWRAVRAFTLACGPQMQTRVRAESYRNGVVTVRVESSAWASQVSMAKAELLRKTQAVPGGQSVRALRFVVGPVADLPDWQETKPPAPPAPKPVEPNPWVSAALTQVPDDELRDALGGLYLLACKAGRGR